MSSSRREIQFIGEALTIVWEATDGICGKRLRQLIAGLIDAMQRHGHLELDPTMRESLLSMSSRNHGSVVEDGRDKQCRRRTMINTPSCKSIAIRTFGDWNDPT
jgi:hypothetical protein